MAVIMNKMLIIDSYGQKKQIQLGVGPVVIPCIGESVVWHYTPAPIVKAVQYDYDKGEVYVLL